MDAHRTNALPYVVRRAGSPAGRTSDAQSARFHPGTGVATDGRGTNADRSTSWYLWMYRGQLG